MSHALRHFLHRELSRGWMAWHAQWQEAARKRESARRGLSHLVNRKLSAGYNTWTEMATERREAMQLMKRGLSMLVNRKMALGFSAWMVATGKAAGRKSAEGHMSHALGHFLHRELSRGWVAWHAQWQEAARKRASARRGLSHLMNRKLSLGWTTWHSVYAANQRMQSLMRSGVASLVSRALAAGFRGWLVSVHVLHVAKRGVRHMLLSEQWRGFRTWAIHCDVGSRRLDVARRGWEAFVRRALRRGWTAWSLLRKPREVLRRALGHFFFSASARLFRTWRAELDGLRGKGASRRAADAHARRFRTVAGWEALLACSLRAARGAHAGHRAIVHWMSSSIGRAFAAWLRSNAGLAERRGQLALFVAAHAIPHNAKTAAKLAMAKWARAVFSKSKVERKIVAQLARRRGRTLSAAWARTVERVRALRLEAGGVATLYGRLLTRGWSGWLEAAVHVLRLRHLARHGDAHAQARGRAAAFARWADLVVADVRAQHAARRALSHLFGRHLGVAWNTWRADFVATRREAAARALRSDSHVLRCRLMSGWRQWLLHLKAAKHAVSKIMAGAGHLFLQGQRKGWHGWKRHLKRRNHTRRLGARAASSLAQNGFVAAWRAWTGMLGGRARAFQFARRAAGHARHTLRHQALRWWRWCIVEKRRFGRFNRSAKAKSAAHRRQRLQRAAFVAWSGRSDADKLSKQLEGLAGSHRMRGGLGRGWFGWLFYVVELKAAGAALRRRAQQHGARFGLVMSWSRWAVGMRRRQSLFVRGQQVVAMVVTRAMADAIRAFTRKRRTAETVARARAFVARQRRARGVADWTMAHTAASRARAAVGMWMRAAVARGWRVWCGDAVARAERRARARVGGHRSARRSVARAFARLGAVRALAHLRRRAERFAGARALVGEVKAWRHRCRAMARAARQQEELARALWARRFDQSWQHWLKTARMSRAARARARAQAMAGGFEIWKEEGARRREAVRLVNRALQKGLRADSLWAFERWRAEAPLRKAARLMGRGRGARLLATGAVHYAAALGARGMSRWADVWAAECRRERGVLRRRQERHVRGVDAFRRQAARRRRNAVLLAHLHRNANIAGWNGIVSAGIARVRAALLSARAAKHAEVSTYVRGWNAVVRTCDRELRRELRARKATKHHRPRALAAAWAGWGVFAARSRFTEARRRQRVYGVLRQLVRAARDGTRDGARAEAAGAHAARAAMSGAFEKLGALHLAAYLTKKGEGRAGEHWQQRALRRCCRGWRANKNARSFAWAAQQQRLARADRKRVHGRLSRTLGLWRGAAGVLSLRAHMARLALRANLAVGWGQAQQGLSWFMEIELLCHRGDRHFVASAVRGGFGAWRRHVIDARIGREVAERGERIGSRKGLSDEWSRVRRGAGEAAAAAKRAKRAALHRLRARLGEWRLHAEGSRLRSGVQQAILRFVAVGCLQAWHRQAQLWRRKQRVLSRGLPDSYPSMLVHGALERHASNVQGRPRVLSRNHKRRVYYLWALWRRQAARRKAMRSTNSMSEGHAQRVAVRVRFEDWGVYLRYVRASSFVMDSGLSSSAPMRLRRGLKQLQAYALRHGPRGAALRGALRTRARLALQRALRSWRRDASHATHIERRVRRGIDSIVTGGLKTALQEWRRQSAARTARRGKARRTVNRWANGRLAHGLSTWNQHRMRVAAAASAGLMLTRSGAFYERRVTRNALRSWMRRRETAVQRVARLWRADGAQLRRAWRLWAAPAVKDARKARRRRAAKAQAARRLRGPTGRAFAAWVSLAHDMRKARAVGDVLFRSAVSFQRSRHALPAFNHWRRASRRNAVSARAAVRGDLRRRHHDLRAALGWWAELTGHHARRGDLMAMADEALLPMQLAACFGRWREHRGLGPLFLEADAFFEARALSEGWDAWTAWMGQLRLLFHSSAAGLPSGGARDHDTLIGATKIGEQQPQRLRPVGVPAPRPAWAVTAATGGSVSPSSAYSPRSDYSPGRSPGRAPARPTMRFH